MKKISLLPATRKEMKKMANYDLLSIHFYGISRGSVAQQRIRSCAESKGKYSTASVGGMCSPAPRNGGVNGGLRHSLQQALSMRPLATAGPVTVAGCHSEIPFVAYPNHRS